MTYDELLELALSHVPDTFDKREGSVIFDAIAPACYALAQTYEDMDEYYNNTFAGTADREGLVQRCAEIGISPNPATHAVRQAIFTPIALNVPIGERFNYEDLNFSVSEKISDGVYSIICETLGSDGNYGAGTLLPINYISGLQTATLTDNVLIYGEDEESTEDLRTRYFATLPAFTIDGNVAQYEKWCANYSGIGNYKIFPLWNGVNTVKVSILSAENLPASQTLMDEFQEYLDPGSEGLGNGQAPIGAVVTVSTATALTINIAATVTLVAGYTEPVGLTEEVGEYLNGLNYSRDTVSYIAIGAIFQNNESIESVLSLTVNGGTVDISLTAEQITALGTIDCEVV